MSFSLDNYLAALEARAAAARAEDFYLWPRTPIGAAIQQKIQERVGVSDHAVASPRSRPALILRQIAALRASGALPPDFSVLDIACGDALILWHIRQAHPHAACFGIDFHLGAFPAHAQAQAAGVRLRRVFIQHLFAEPPGAPFDLVLMLNTYRGWDSADLRPHERDLPRQADAWFARAARYVIVTATRPQLAALRRQGFALQTLGRGEEHSTMICFSKHPLPQLPRRPWWSNW